MERVHSLIFGMLFPAFHGAFLLALFTTPAPQGLPPWGPLLVVYFAAQFVEGVEARQGYGRARALVNLFEIVLMVLMFAALGYFPDVRLPPSLNGPEAIRWMMFLAFAMPALHRLLLGRPSLGRGAPGYLFARFLTGMSIAAALLSIFITSMVAWVAALLILASYMLFFQFANDWLVLELSRRHVANANDYRRPQIGQEIRLTARGPTE